MGGAGLLVLTHTLLEGMMSSDGEQKFIGSAPELNPAGLAASLSHQKATQTGEVTENCEWS